MDATELKEFVLDKLGEVGFVVTENGALCPPVLDKEGLRQIHKPASQLEIASRQDWLRRYLPEYLSFFANGDEIVPAGVLPTLGSKLQRSSNIISSGWLGCYGLFHFLEGFGRRPRFLIMDEANGKLISLLALQSPPAQFSSTGSSVSLSPWQKDGTGQPDDGYSNVGEPYHPYDRLLGGKLIALAAASNEIRQVYWRKYSGRATEMEGRILPPHLVALTTTSAFGRAACITG